MDYVVCSDAMDFMKRFTSESVDLFLFDPPYFNMVGESWDRQWPNLASYVEWFDYFVAVAKWKLKPGGSMLFFGGVGSHGVHPFWEAVKATEKSLHYRNTITWKKRRAYGKSHDYLFCREEIAWFSRSPERTRVTFNIPLLDVKRGYAGWDKKHPAKSEFKRVSNVWDDIPELMRPERPTQKPIPLMQRLVRTHSDEGQLVVDPFAGWGSTGVAALELGRDFRGCDLDSRQVPLAQARCEQARSNFLAKKLNEG